MRQEAWLSADIEEFGGTRLQWLKKRKGDDGLASFRVDPGPLKWLIDMLADAGGFRTIPGFGGTSNLPLAWADICSWVEGACMQDVSVFWRREIMRLSKELVSQMSASARTDCPAPFDPGANE